MEAAQSMVDILTTQVRNANFTTTDTLHKNAQACIVNAMGYVSPTPRLELLGNRAMSAARAFAAKLTMLNPAEEERRAALSALAEFRAELENAAPSNMARHLGF